MFRFSPFFFALLLVLSACGGGGGGSRIGTNPCDEGAVCGELALSLDAVNAGGGTTLRAGAPVAAAALALAPEPPPWRSSGIISGPPDELRLYVKLIAAAPAGGGDLVPIFSSPDDRGTLVSLTSGAVDLAGALGVAGFQLPPGDYERLEVDFSRVAEISGCVSGVFQQSDPVTGRVRDLNPGWAASAPRHADNVYSNDPIADLEPHTFCTTTSRSEVAVGTFTTETVGSNDDFEAVETPTPTEIDLALDNRDDLDRQARIQATVTIATPGTFSVAETTPVSLKLAMDLDRMLRYFANTRSELGAPNPNMKGGTSYFFTTVFPFSTVLVADENATVEGYRLTVIATSNQGSGQVPGWLTVIRDADGDVVGGMVMGDDDNDLTVAKGNLAPAVDDGDGVWTLEYALGQGDGAQPFSGRFEGFQFQEVGSSGTCDVTVQGADWLNGFTGFTASYTREL